MTSPAAPTPVPEPVGLSIPPGPWQDDMWLIERPVREATSGTDECAVTSCALPAGRAVGDRPHDTDILCVAHRRRLRKSASQPRLSTFIEEQATASPIRKPRGDPGRRQHYPPIDFTLVSPRLREELRYVAAVKILRNHWRDPRYVNGVILQAISVARAKGHTSLSDFADNAGLHLTRRRASEFPAPLGDALPGMLQLVTEATADPWESLHWHPADLGFADGDVAGKPVRWDSVTCDWLRGDLMRLAREHIRAGTRAWSTLRSYVRAGSLLSAYMNETTALAPEELTRGAFLDFLGWARSEHSTRTDLAAVNQAASLLVELRERGIEPALPDTFYLLRGENPATRTRQPKPFPADILDAIDQMAAREDDEVDADVRLMLRLFRAVGPRASEALALPVDCVLHSERGYTLEYFMTKTDDWRRVPLPDRLGADLVHQAQRVREVHGESCKWLFPYVGPAPRVNNLGKSAGKIGPWPYGRFRDAVWAAYQSAGITESKLTGEVLRGPSLHRFRHSVATGLLREGWSQYEVQQFLAHKSPTMMQAYAEIHEDDLREKYIEYATKSIDVTGTHPHVDVEAVADVERLRDRLIRTTLPNGYCTLPEKQTCDYAPTPCLTCKPFFRTTPTFLPIHIRQRDESLKELELAREDGRERAVRAHEQTVSALNTIIDGLEQQAAAHADER